jgi:4'-phosphopantetheinyl transferase EntD
MSMLGVDLERVSTGDLAGIESLNTNELGPPGLSMAVAKLVSFSCKEAVFKAQYPSTGRLLGFSDVTLNSWDYGRCFNAAVRCPTPGLTVRAAVSDDWVVSVAFRPPQMLP